MSVSNSGNTMTQLIESLTNLSDLGNEESKKTVLTELKKKLESLPDDEVKNIANNINYNTIFAQLFSNDR